jgi:hypothetical protein
MKVENIRSNKGNKIANQFIITDGNREIFQSYNSIIAIKEYGKPTILGKDWDYSKTTGKYRNIFLNCTKKDIIEGLKAGLYVLDVTI